MINTTYPIRELLKSLRDKIPNTSNFTRLFPYDEAVIGMDCGRWCEPSLDTEHWHQDFKRVRRR